MVVSPLISVRRLANEGAVDCAGAVEVLDYSRRDTKFIVFATKQGCFRLYDVGKSPVEQEETNIGKKEVLYPWKIQTLLGCQVTKTGNFLVYFSHESQKEHRTNTLSI